MYYTKDSINIPPSSNTQAGFQVIDSTIDKIELLIEDMPHEVIRVDDGATFMMGEESMVMLELSGKLVEIDKIVSNHIYEAMVFGMQMDMVKDGFEGMILRDIIKNAKEYLEKKNQDDSESSND